MGGKNKLWRKIEKLEKLNFSGLLYFYVHFATEVLCFYCLNSIVEDKAFLWFISLVYDFLAFVPQILFGAISDRFEKVPFGVIGTLMMIAGLLLSGQVPIIIVTVIIALGNAMVHVNGAEVTLRSGKGKITPASMFVAGGSFGLITGTLMANFVPMWVIVAMAAISLVAIIIAERYRVETRRLKVPCKDFKTANLALPIWLVVFMATFVVAVRGFVGYSIPTSWNKTVFQTILLFVFMGAGKALGGLLVDKIGIRKTIFISMIGAIPFLIFGNEVMALSLVGVMFFSMTMAITLSILVSVFPKNPGVAFGFTTVGLFLGSLPQFFFRITDLLVNDIIVVVASLLCFFILLLITRKDKKNA